MSTNELVGSIISAFLDAIDECTVEIGKSLEGVKLIKASNKDRYVRFEVIQGKSGPYATVHFYEGGQTLGIDLLNQNSLDFYPRWLISGKFE